MNAKWDTLEKSLKNASTAFRTLFIAIVVGYSAIIADDHMISYSGRVVLICSLIFGILDSLQFFLGVVKSAIDFDESSSKRELKWFSKWFLKWSSKTRFTMPSLFYNITLLLFFLKVAPFATAAIAIFADAWDIL